MSAFGGKADVIIEKADIGASKEILAVVAVGQGAFLGFGGSLNGEIPETDLV